jgi:hypothetical protein
MPDDRTTVSPVFVDPTGRRRRTIRTAAVVGAGALFATAGLLVAALLGAPVGPLVSVPTDLSGPPAAVAPNPQPPQVTGTSGAARPGSSARNKQGAQPAVTTTADSTTTTTSAKGKPVTPPGRPSDLPSPPGHTR